MLSELSSIELESFSSESTISTQEFSKNVQPNPQDLTKKTPNLTLEDKSIETRVFERFITTVKKPQKSGLETNPGRKFYISDLTRGFYRILFADQETELKAHFLEICPPGLIKKCYAYIVSSIKGKTSGGSRAKVNSMKDFEIVFHPQPKDSEQNRVIKNVVKKAFEFFMTDRLLFNFLKCSCGSQDETKSFIWKNRYQIKCKFRFEGTKSPKIKFEKVSEEDVDNFNTLTFCESCLIITKTDRCCQDVPPVTENNIDIEEGKLEETKESNIEVELYDSKKMENVENYLTQESDDMHQKNDKENLKLQGIYYFEQSSVDL